MSSEFKAASTDIQVERQLRAVAGLICAPILAALFMALVWPVSILMQFGVVSFSASMLVFGVASLIGIPVALLFGWPLHRMALALRWTHWAAYMAIGALLCVLTVLSAVGVVAPQL